MRYMQDDVAAERQLKASMEAEPARLQAAMAVLSAQAGALKADLQQQALKGTLLDKAMYAH